MHNRVRHLVPGLILLGLVASLAWVIGQFVSLLPPIVLAIGIGVVAGNTVGVPTWGKPGVARYKDLLEAAIVLLGAGVSVGALLAAGPRLLGLVLGVVVFGIIFVEALARLVGLSRVTGSLLAAGSSVCGVSAVAAVAVACRARSATIAHAAATIVLFDVVGLLVLPPLGSVLGIDAQAFGIWVGVTMFSTGPVTAAGFAHSPVAGEWATVTKLSRNALIGFVAVAYSIHYASGRDECVGGTKSWSAQVSGWIRQILDGIPLFLIGFVLLVLVANAGLLPTGLLTLISTLSSTLFLLAFAGLGIQLRVESVRQTGVVPIIVLGTYMIVIGALSYVAVTVLW